VIIGFCNEKGGVGKTTLSIHAATWLARQGRRVALVDLDTQGGVAHFLGLQPADDVAELMRSVLYLRVDRRPNISSFLCHCPAYSTLGLIRGFGATGEVEAELHQPGRMRPGAILAEALGPLTRQGVIVVMDTGPHAGKLQEAVLEAADHVFVPGIPEGATEAGIVNIGQHLQDLGRTITGLIPTRVVITSAKHKQTIEDWQHSRGLEPVLYYDPPRLVGVPQRVVWSQLYRAAKPIWDVVPQAVSVRREDLEVARKEMTAVLERLEFDVGLRSCKHARTETERRMERPSRGGRGT